MGKVNYAAIDIGSNAVRLLIKSIDREAVQEKKIKKVLDVFQVMQYNSKCQEDNVSQALDKLIMFFVFILFLFSV